MSKERPAKLETGTALLDKQSKWSKKKIAAVVLAVVVLLCVSLFEVASVKVREAAGQAILTRANGAVNGLVTVGEIDLSILGAVEVKQVKVFDASGKQLATSDRVLISYNWSDLLHGQLGPQLIKDVTIEKAELWVEYSPEKLNWDNLFKPQAANAERFSGVVTFKDAQVHLQTPLFTKIISQLSGTIDLGQNDPWQLSADGKLDQAPISLSGQWGVQEASLVTLSGKNIDLVSLGLTEAEDPIQLTKGRLDEVTVQVAKSKAGVTTLKTLIGRFSGVDTSGAAVLTQGGAHFEKQGDTIQFIDGQALYKGQTVTADGQVMILPNGAKTMNFAVKMPAGDPAAVLSGLAATGPLAVQGTLAGSVISPVLNGNFSLPSLQFGDMTVSDISGAFSYAGQTMTLLSATGSMVGGSVSADGEIYPELGRFSLGISGSGLDSSRLTPKDVQGPMALSGTAVGDAAGAVAQGSFVIAGGKAYGISFQTLTGDFVKRGSAETEISNMAIRTEFGTFYPDKLSKDVMEQLQKRNFPATREAVEDEVKQQITNKLLKQIFR